MLNFTITSFYQFNCIDIIFSLLAAAYNPITGEQYGSPEVSSHIFCLCRFYYFFMHTKDVFQFMHCDHTGDGVPLTFINEFDPLTLSGRLQYSFAFHSWSP